jgi:hypothetical protein
MMRTPEDDGNEKIKRPRTITTIVEAQGMPPLAIAQAAQMIK